MKDYIWPFLLIYPLSIARTSIALAAAAPLTDAVDFAGPHDLIIGMLARGNGTTTLDEAGQNFLVEIKTSHIDIPTGQPAGGTDAGAGQVMVGSSSAGTASANKEAIRYADKGLQFCDGREWRSLSTVPGHP